MTLGLGPNAGGGVEGAERADGEGVESGEEKALKTVKPS
jgi:hypothetical protein